MGEGSFAEGEVVSLFFLVWVWGLWRLANCIIENCDIFYVLPLFWFFSPLFPFPIPPCLIAWLGNLIFFLLC